MFRCFNFFLRYTGDTCDNRKRIYDPNICYLCLCVYIKHTIQAFTHVYAVTFDVFFSTSFNITFKIRYVTLSKVFIQSLNRLFRSILGSSRIECSIPAYIYWWCPHVCLSFRKRSVWKSVINCLTRALYSFNGVGGIVLMLLVL